MLGLLGGSATQGSSVAKPRQKHSNPRQKRSKPRLPTTFFGVNPNAGTPSAAAFARMRAGGIGSFRSPMYWRGINRAPGAFNWVSDDLVMLRAATAGLDVLPFLYSTPHYLNTTEWKMPVGSAPEEQAWKSFLAAAVARYGPGGGFWALNPSVPYSPIRSWQIWNEENIDSFTRPISPVGYGRLLKISRQVIKQADPGAKIVIGGLFGDPYRPKLNGDMNDFAFMKRLYRIKGIKSAFDAYALHPYATTARDMKKQILMTRALMKSSGDARTPLWIDEFGWGSGHDISLPSARGPRGQKKQLEVAYRMLKRNRVRWRIGRTYWFSWDDDPQTSCAICTGSGLFTSAGKPKPAWYAFVKLTGGRP